LSIAERQLTSEISADDRSFCSSSLDNVFIMEET